MYQPGGKLPPEGRGMKWVEMALELSSKNVVGGVSMGGEGPVEIFVPF